MKKSINKEKKRRLAQANKLRPYLGVDMCACCTLLRCEGVCRETHTNNAGEVVCFELYQIDPSLVNFKSKDKRHERGLEKTEIQEHSEDKRRRREKLNQRKNQRSQE